MILSPSRGRQSRLRNLTIFTAILLCCILIPVWWQGVLVQIPFHQVLAARLRQDFVRSSSSVPPKASSFNETARIQYILEKLYPLQRARYIQHLKDAPCHHQPPATRNATTAFQSSTSVSSYSSSSMEFIACCGLGHRLMRLSTAALLSKVLRIPLYPWWGCCDRTRVFEHLFGAEPIVMMNTTGASLNMMPIHLQFRLEIRGPIFGMVRPENQLLLSPSVANGTESSTSNNKNNKQQNERAFVSCNISQAKIDSDSAFYQQLRNRYARKDQVDAFVQSHFQNTLSIGVHIRAGNGERGDFVQKRRGIHDKEHFLAELATHVETLAEQHAFDKTTQKPIPTVIFVATDMPSYITDLRNLLKKRRRRGTGNNRPTSKISVVDFPQVRPPEGSGVLFGMMGKVRESGKECLEGWHAVVMDALLLSHTDIVLAPRPSSLTQSLPLALVLSKNPHEKRVATPFCEIQTHARQTSANVSASALLCFSSVREWACGTTDSKTNFYDVLPKYAKYIT